MPVNGNVWENGCGGSKTPSLLHSGPASFSDSHTHTHIQPVRVLAKLLQRSPAYPEWSYAFLVMWDTATPRAKPLHIVLSLDLTRLAGGDGNQTPPQVL